MPYYALLFKGGLPHAKLTKEYFDRFVEWAMKIASNEIPGNRFKQEGKVVSSERVDDLKFSDDTVGGYLMIKADNYDKAVDVAKGCPILENGGSVEVREVIPRTDA
jgi:YCII-related domain-containing protein